MIRNATAEDIPAILVLGEAFFNEAGWPRLASWDGPSTATFLTSLIEGKITGGLIVAERDGEIIGMAAYLLFPFYCNFAETMAQEVFWYAKPEKRLGTGLAMLNEIERQAAERGAKIMVMAAVSGLRDEALARFYQRRGYSSGEVTFMKRISA